MSRGAFAALYAAGDPFALIDTRERRDHVNGHWFGSTNVPLSVLADRIGHLIPDRSFPIHVLDWADLPSKAAQDCFAQLGYRNVHVIPTEAPTRFGKGWVRGEYVWSKAFGEVVAHASGLAEVTPEQFLADPDAPMLFDVRPTAEYGEFTIPGSRSLPNSLLLANMEALRDTGRTALLHCAGRTRSIIGASTLHAAGYTGAFAIFKGGTQAWQLDGHEREFGADRIFAAEHGGAAAVQAFLRKWDIACGHARTDDLAELMAEHGGDLLFDVSDDAARGVPVSHGITRVSGTNLIQQTDRSVARYHVPVVLFDQGSGSRAAFAALWLKTMGFAVSVVILDQPLEVQPISEATPATPGQDNALSAAALLGHRNAGGAVYDFRPSTTFNADHLTGAEWRNVSAVLAGEQGGLQISDPVALIGGSPDHGRHMAELLQGAGCQIAGHHTWDADAFDASERATGGATDPIDVCALFAGRHHGNMQDSRDYLTWEEDLPDQIDRGILTLWQSALAAVFAL